MAKNTGYSRQQCCQGLTSGFITSSDSCFNTMSFSVSKSNHFNCCLIAEICRWDLKHDPFGILLLKLFLCCESLTDGVVFIREIKSIISIVMHLPKSGLFFYSPPLTPIISKVDFIFHSICDSSMLKFAQGCGSVEEYKSEEIIQISHYYDPLKSSELL